MSLSWLRQWVKSKFSITRHARRGVTAHRSLCRRRPSFRPMLEHLEDRWLLSAPETAQLAPDTSGSSPAYIVDDVGKLFTVNVSTGQTEYVGQTGTVMYDIAINQSGQMYGLGKNGDLYRINAATAATTTVGQIVDKSSGEPILSDANAMEFRGDGALFVAAQNEVYQVNPQTATAQQVLTLPDGETSAGDLVFDTKGDMFLTTNDGSLVEANPTLTSAQIVGNTGVNDLFGLVWSNGSLCGFSDSQDAIYKINPATAAVSLQANLNASDGTLPDGVDGATSTPLSLAAAPPTYIIDTEGNLFTVNDTTGQTQFVGQTGVDLSDIALAPSGQMYGMGQNGNLYQIDDATGSTTLVGPLINQSTGQPIPYDTFIMAFRSDGALFIATQSDVYQVNPQTAAAQLVFTNGDILTSDEMVFDTHGDMFLTAGNGSLLEVNPSLTSVQTIGDTGVDDLYGLAWSGGALYGFSQSQDDIYQINTATAAASLQANLTPTDGVQPDGVNGATSAPCPYSLITFSPSAIPAGTVGAAYTQSITVSGGSGAMNVTDSVTSGAIPAGLNFKISGNTLTISGTPRASSTVSFDVTATDSGGDEATQSYTLTVQSAATTGAAKIGVFCNGAWYLDTDGNDVWDPSGDTFASFGFPGAIPVVGNWGPNGASDIGVYYNGTWYLNTDGTDVWKGNGNGNIECNFGFAGATPVVGNWGPNGSTGIGVYYNGTWYLNTDGTDVWKGNGNGNIECNFGFAGATPVVGNWGPNGSTGIGVYCNGLWYVNTDGTDVWKGNGNGNVEYNFGFAGAAPVVGNWGPNGAADIGVYANGTWYVNTDGSGDWKGNGFGNVEYNFGFAGSVLVVGNWQSPPLLMGDNSAQTQTVTSQPTVTPQDQIVSAFDQIVAQTAAKNQHSA